MSEMPTKLLDDRIVEMIQRVRTLAAERDAFQRENEALKFRLEAHERENARLRDVLAEAARELRQE